MKRRNTEATEEILSLLKNSGTALNHEMIQQTASVAMDRATIYRVLNRFHKDKRVHKVVGDDGRQYFAYCAACTKGQHAHNHFHFRCTRCGKVECLGEEIDLSLPNGYSLENFNGMASGICKACSHS